MSKMWMRKMSKCEAEKVKLIAYKYTVIFSLKCLFLRKFSWKIKVVVYLFFQYK